MDYSTRCAFDFTDNFTGQFYEAHRFESVVLYVMFKFQIITQLFKLSF